MISLHLFFYGLKVGLDKISTCIFILITLNKLDYFFLTETSNVLINYILTLFCNELVTKLYFWKTFFKMVDSLSKIMGKVAVFLISIYAKFAWSFWVQKVTFCSMFATWVLFADFRCLTFPILLVSSFSI